VVTPHVSEAATLLGQSVAEVQLDRPAAALALAERVAAAGCGVSVLKGAGSVIAEHGSQRGRLLGVCGHGNPGMASAGMGDVLSGVIGGFMAQGMSVAEAAQLGVTVHSRAADVAVADTGERGLLATDLLPEMMRLLK
jgi:NAD(P)H-hydrate epimerase